METKEALNYLMESVSCLKVLQLPLSDDSELKDEIEDIICQIYSLEEDVRENDAFENKLIKQKLSEGK